MGDDWWDRYGGIVALFFSAAVLLSVFGWIELFAP